MRRHPWLRVSFVALAAACGPTVYQAVGEPVAVGADATIELDEVEGGNILVNVKVTHLPPPDRLADGATTYVVWFVSPAGSVNAGTLAYDADARSGSLVATSTETTFRLLITAEPSRAADRPSVSVVIDREVSY